MYSSTLFTLATDEQTFQALSTYSGADLTRRHEDVAHICMTGQAPGVNSATPDGEQ